MTDIEIPWTGEMRSDDEAVWLLERVDEWQQSTHEPRYHPGYFHASQLGESDADLIAQYRGVLAYVPRDNDTLRIFDMGKGIDGDWKRYLKQSKLSVVADEEARHISMPYLRLSGDLDDIVQKSETGDWYVVEVKSTSAFKYSRLKGPEPQHLLQATCYMSATQIPRVIFVYQHRDTGRRRAFYRQFDHNIWSQIVQRLLRLRSEAEAMDGTLDPKIVDLSLRLNAELAK